MLPGVVKSLFVGHLVHLGSVLLEFWLIHMSVFKGMFNHLVGSIRIRRALMIRSLYRDVRDHIWIVIAVWIFNLEIRIVEFHLWDEGLLVLI